MTSLSPDTIEAIERLRTAPATSDQLRGGVQPRTEGPTRRQLMMLADDMGMASVSDAAEYARAAFARWGRPAQSPAEALAARPLLEQVARMGDCIGANTVSEIMTISDRAAAWLEANPPGQPVAIEPRGCPAPGACGCVEPAPQPVADEEVEELVKWLRATGDLIQPEHLAEHQRYKRAADLLERHHPQPIPVSKRLPGPEDGVVIPWSELRSPHVWAGKRCLINGPTEIWDWTFATIPCVVETGEFSHWLPANTPVLPAGAIRQS